LKTISALMGWHNPNVLFWYRFLWRHSETSNHHF